MVVRGMNVCFMDHWKAIVIAILDEVLSIVVVFVIEDVEIALLKRCRL